MRPAGRRTAWVLIVAVACLYATGELLLIAAGGDPVDSSPVVSLSFTAMTLVYLVVGGLVLTRLPTNPVGWLFCGTGLFLGVTTMSSGYAALVLDPATGDGGSLGVAAAWVTSWTWIPPLLGFPALLFLLFPDGHPVGRRWRWVLGLVSVSLVCVVAGAALAEGSLGNSPSPLTDNPVGLLPRGVADGISAAGFVLSLIALVLACWSLVIRLRRARPVERQQLKWLMWSAGLLPAYLMTGLVRWLLDDSFGGLLAEVLLAVCMTMVPLAVGTAILRHRLYDIDVVIHRSLVYGALTVTLGTTYLVSVLVLRVTLDPLTNDSDLAVAASTLAVAALFRPLRTRIQSLVDRRFYRARYDAARTLDRFATHLRDQLDLRSLQDDLCGVVRDTVHPTRVSLWMRGSAR